MFSEKNVGNFKHNVIRPNLSASGNVPFGWSNPNHKTSSFTMFHPRRQRQGGWEERGRKRSFFR